MILIRAPRASAKLQRSRATAIAPSYHCYAQILVRDSRPDFVVLNPGYTYPLIPAKAGIQESQTPAFVVAPGSPAFAGASGG